jgi:predicted secreted protein
MVVANILNPSVRRTVLVVTLVPLVIFVLVFNVSKAIWEVLKDIPGAFVYTWEGSKRAR